MTSVTLAVGTTEQLHGEIISFRGRPFRRPVTHRQTHTEVKVRSGHQLPWPALPTTCRAPHTQTDRHRGQGQVRSGKCRADRQLATRHTHLAGRINSMTCLVTFEAATQGVLWGVQLVNDILTVFCRHFARAESISAFTYK